MTLARIYSRLSPKMGPYGEYFLPMTFSKYRTKDVVLNTRKPGSATIFDVSHMGIFETVEKELLEEKFMVNFNKFKNRSRLCGLLDSRGYILDDIIIGDVNHSKFRMVVNSNTKDIYRQIPSFIERKKSILAVQGDLSQKIVEELFNVKLDNMYFMDNKSVVPNEIELCRCGYTGEDGFEIYLKEEIGDEIREKLVDLSLKNDNIMFGGLVERDLLRLEAGLCLSGVEFGEDMDIDFKALGMDFMVGLKHRKEKNFNSDFIRSGFVGTRPIKKGEIVDQQGEEVGLITSSNKSFNLNKFIGMGYIRKDRIDNKLEGIERVELPFIEANYKRK